jgi:hypothetical protein
VTALSILAQATAAGLTLRPLGDRIRFRPVENMTPELLAEVREHRAALLDILRAGRVAEVRAFYSQAFSRLAALYPDSMIGDLWPTITREHPALASAINTAEAASDAAGLAYQSGDAPDAGQFLAALATWERAWAEAIAAVTNTSRACDDCGRTDATVMVETDTGRYCRRCLRPEPIAARPKTKGMDA